MGLRDLLLCAHHLCTLVIRCGPGSGREGTLIGFGAGSQDAWVVYGAQGVPSIVLYFQSCRHIHQCSSKPLTPISPLHVITTLTIHDKYLVTFSNASLWLHGGLRFSSNRFVLVMEGWKYWFIGRDSGRTS